MSICLRYFFRYSFSKPKLGVHTAQPSFVVVLINVFDDLRLMQCVVTNHLLLSDFDFKFPEILAVVE